MRKELAHDTIEDYKIKLQSMDEILHQISCMDQAENEQDLSLMLPPLLKAIGKYTNADRVYIFDWVTKERDSLGNTHEWCADGIKPEIDNLQSVPISLMPSWMKKFNNSEVIVIKDLETIKMSTPQEYEFLKAQDICSVIAVPIYANHTMNGFIGVDNPDLSQDEISINLLSNVGGHLGCVRENLKNIQLLKKSMEEAQRANISKTDFLRRMSHDIRTPLNGIVGMIHIAQKYTNDEEKLMECRRKVLHSTDYLQDLVNNVLDISKLESGSLILENKPFDLVELLRKQLTVIETNAYEHGIQFEGGLDISIIKHRYLNGSPLYLNRVLMNLASNAIKYNRPYGKIKLSCTEISSTKDIALYQFVCKDTGLGMSKEFQKHAFEPFTQEGKETITSFSGSGLGLSIVKDIVELMNGTIELKSEENIGTTFTITIPFKIDYTLEEKKSEELLEKEIDLKGYTALLVEDNELNMEIARILLQDEGMNIIEAKNGKEAVEIFKSSIPNTFDFIFMDIMMPVMDGLEATKQIRKLERFDAKAIPIIAMTANAFDEDRKDCINAGMSEHIGKPIDISELKKVINSQVD